MRIRSEDIFLSKDIVSEAKAFKVSEAKAFKVSEAKASKVSEAKASKVRRLYEEK